MSQQKVSRNLAQVKRGALHIGVDLGLENNVAIVISEHAERLDRFRFSNDRDGYEYFQQRIDKLQRENKAPDIMIAMEPTSYLWKLLASDLEQKGIAYRLVNAYTVKKHREGDQLDRSKDDPRDAFTIADLSRTGKYTETQLQHGAYAELRQYISLYYRMKRQIRREKQVAYIRKRVILFIVVFIPFVYVIGMLNAWLFHLNSILENPSLERFLFSGWISYGAIIGGLLFGLIYPRIIKDTPYEVLDIIALILPLFEGFYRIGCLLNGCCHGKETHSFWGLFLPNSSGTWLIRYPTQILYIVLGFVLFAILWKTRKNKRYEGELTVRYLTVYGLGRFLIDGMRVNLIDLGWINLHQATDLGLLLTGLIVWCANFFKERSKNTN
jgi:phosphatidylglycerol---prolipoprotein diacylglyceryl transferase